MKICAIIVQNKTCLIVLIWALVVLNNRFWHNGITHYTEAGNSLTNNPHHDKHLCPGELCCFDTEDLTRVVSNGLIGKVFDPVKSV